MTVLRRTKNALKMLLPVGVLGISSALAAMHLKPSPPDPKDNREGPNVADRLQEIRAGVSEVDDTRQYVNDDGVLLAEWPNFHFGWGNGGWRNGGWRNGGWHNWHNGWHNWGNGGWHNWHNYWNNW